MRIGLVIYGSLNTISGGYLYDRQLADYLRRAGHSVEIISLPWRNYAAHLADNFSNALYRRLRRARVDVLLQDELNHPSLSRVNQRLQQSRRYPIVSIVHHLRISEAQPAWLKIFYRAIERQYLASVDGFIFNSETTRAAVENLLHRAAPNSVVALPAGDRFNPDIDAGQIRVRAKTPGALRIVFVGNLIPRKGLHILLDALARLSGNTWQLTVIGNPNVDPRYTSRIRSQIAAQHLANVRLVGAIQDSALANILATSQVLAVPSEYEGYGIVYLEGMGFGLPAIATTAGAAREIIDNGVNGFLIAPNNSAKLAVCLAALDRDRDRLCRMSLAARERFLAHPSWDASMARVSTLLQVMLSHNPP